MFRLISDAEIEAIQQRSADISPALVCTIMVRRAIDNSTHPDVLRLIASAEEYHQDTLRHLARNPNTPPEILDQIARKAKDTYTVVDEHVDVATRVAANPNTSPDTLVFLADHKRADVRRRVAENPHTPSEVLCGLMADKKAYVRRSLLRNPALPPELRAMLALSHP